MVVHYILNLLIMNKTEVHMDLELQISNVHVLIFFNTAIPILHMKSGIQEKQFLRNFLTDFSGKKLMAHIYWNFIKMKESMILKEL